MIWKLYWSEWKCGLKIITYYNIHITVTLKRKEFALNMQKKYLLEISINFSGSCNANQTDDIKTSTDEITEDTDKFGKSWRATDLPIGKCLYCLLSVSIHVLMKCVEFLKMYSSFLESHLKSWHYFCVLFF